MKAIQPVHKGNLMAGRVMGPIWDEFSPVKNRTEHHAFLFNVLKKFSPNSTKIKVLDTCLGSGLDAIPLSKKGYEVTGNEFDPNYRTSAVKNIKKEKVDIGVIDYNWLELGRYKPKSLYDVVLCVGNSICYVFGKDNQKKVIKNFCRLVRPGGLLVIDERNFQFLLDHRREVLDKKEQFVATHSGLNKHILYGGEKYYPYPVDINDDMVTMGLWKTGKKKPISHFYFHPFKRGELLELLKETFGNKNVVVYSDYKKNYNDEAGFYQYVCKNKLS